MFSPTGLPFYPDYELLFLLKLDLELQCLFCTLRIFELLHLILVPLSNHIPMVTFRGVLSSVSVSLYRYGQPKPNILVCEILNRNQPKWLENHQFWCISVSVGFGRFSVFQREGYWDFQNHTLSNDKAKTKAYKITLRIDKKHRLKTFHTDHSKAKSPFTWKKKSQYKRNKTNIASSVKKLIDYMRIWDIWKIREVEIYYSWCSSIWSEEKKLGERELEKLKNLSEEFALSVCVKQSHRWFQGKG